MKETFNPVSAVCLIILVIMLSIAVCVAPANTDSEVTAEVIPTTEPTVTETTEPTVTIPEEVVEETQLAVDNLVNDVPNSVEDELTPIEPQVPTATESATPKYTDEELEILAIIIYQEAGGDAFSDDTRRKVGSVFLNRVNSDWFPNTFYEVATARSQYGTLYWTGLKWPAIASSAGEEHAVDRAYRIAEELLVNGSILPGNVIWQAEFLQGDGLYCEQDGFYFCYTEVKE